MDALPPELRPLFVNIEENTDLEERTVAEALFRFVQENESAVEPIKATTDAERFVFTLATDETGERGDWGAYFRPMYVVYEEDGVRTSHALQLVTRDTISYWTRRAGEAKHPVLRSRYADAAWELAPFVEGASRDISNARTAIASYAERAATANEVYPTIWWLRRALNLSLAISDTASAEQVVESMFRLHDRAVNPAMAGASTALFDSVFPLRRKLKLSKERLDRMIASLEECLRVTSGTDDAQKLDHHAAQMYGERLLKHYWSVGSQSDVERVTRLFATAIEHRAAQVMPMIATAWLDDVHLAYQRAGLKADAERVLVEMKEKGRQAKGQMVSHVSSATFTSEEVEGFLGEMMTGGLDAAFVRIIKFFLPKAGDLRERLASHREKTPLMSIFPIALMADDQVTARVGATGQDEEGRLVHEIAQDSLSWSPFLMESLERLFREHDLTADDFVSLLFHTPLFGVERYQLLRNGIRHYREDDQIAAIHVLVPLIEHALRTLLEVMQRPTNLHNPKLGAYQEKDLGTILADEAIAKVLGEDTTRYLRTLLTDQRGWNLRNRLSHGLYDSRFFSRQIADRVIHILMILSMIRPESDDPTEAKAEPE